VNRGPVGEQEIFVAGADIRLQVTAARVTCINSQAILSFNRQDPKKAIIFVITERTHRSPELPSCSTKRARKQSLPAGIDAHQLRHRRTRSAHRAVAATPLIFVAPGAEFTYYWMEILRESTPAKIAKYPRARGRQLVRSNESMNGLQSSAWIVSKFSFYILHLLPNPLVRHLFGKCVRK
jgi:hypothetical protein